MRVCYSAPNSPPRNGEILDISDSMAYVQFDGCNRRMDLWVELSSLSRITSPKRIRQKPCPDFFPKNSLPPRNIERILFGAHLINCWYYSPYPLAWVCRELFVCDFCAVPFTTEKEYFEHNHREEDRCPPGREIYRDGPMVLFEVSPIDNKHFCQLLSLLGHLFIETFSDVYFRTLNYFHFYVLCEVDDHGAHIVGYFSRISEWIDPTIISHILVLPPFQGRGFGGLMIAIAYEIAYRQGIIGGPKYPLGDLGRVAFKSFWIARVCLALEEEIEEIETVQDIADLTAIRISDVVETLTDLGLVETSANPLLIQKSVQDFVRAGNFKRMRIPFNRELLEWGKGEVIDDTGDSS
jgi:histone acetyltransferase MYST1